MEADLPITALAWLAVMTRAVTTGASMSESATTNDPDLLTWRRPGPTPTQRQIDIALAFALFAGAVLSLALTRAYGFAEGEAGPGLPTSSLILAALTLPLIWRRRYPAVVAIVVSLLFLVVGETGGREFTFTNIAMFMGLYTVGAWDVDRRRATWVRGVIIAGMALWLLTSFFRASTADIGLEGTGIGAMTPIAALMLQQLLVNALYFVGAYWFGNHAWTAARQRAILAARALELQTERARLARQAVTIERLRIARELHDAVAHHVSLMGVQAGAARAVLPPGAETSTAQLIALEDSARSAISELYNLLGTLRDDEAPESEPARGAAGLPALVDEARAVGILVDFEIVDPTRSSGAPRDLAPLVDLTVYRITQEALTNVVKHAGIGARASVRLRYLEHAVEVEVSDNGGGRPTPSTSGGLGLTGMRERVAALAGSLEAAPRKTGGFIVRASLPTSSATPSAPSPAPSSAQSSISPTAPLPESIPS